VYFTILHYLVIDWSLFADDDVLPESVSAERVAQETMAAGMDSNETLVSSVVAGYRLIVAWPFVLRTHAMRWRLSVSFVLQINYEYKK
jgi:hypothetical protein